MWRPSRRCAPSQDRNADREKASASSASAAPRSSRGTDGTASRVWRAQRLANAPIATARAWYCSSIERMLATRARYSRCSDITPSVMSTVLSAISSTTSSERPGPRSTRCSGSQTSVSANASPASSRPRSERAPSTASVVILDDMSASERRSPAAAVAPAVVPWCAEDPKGGGASTTGVGSSARGEAARILCMTSWVRRRAPVGGTGARTGADRHAAPGVTCLSSLCYG